MIRPVQSYNPYQLQHYKSSKPQFGHKKQNVGYGHSLGVSSLYGLGAFGISNIFLNAKPAAIVGLTVAGLMMLFNVPQKMYTGKW